MDKLNQEMFDVLKSSLAKMKQFEMKLNAFEERLKKLESQSITKKESV